MRCNRSREKSAKNHNQDHGWTPERKKNTTVKECDYETGPGLGTVLRKSLDLS